MIRLPLFPLPVVLLPGVALPLHIFEPRYRRLVTTCVEARAPFGIVYHDPDVHGPFLFEDGRVGTEARIEAYRPLPDGRSFVLVRGGERFRIVGEEESPEPFYEARVAPFAGGSSARAPDVLSDDRRRSVALFHSVLSQLGDGARADLPAFDTSQDVSFALASHIEIDPQWLQALLELDDEAVRLERLDAVFRAALIMGDVPPDTPDERSFS